MKSSHKLSKAKSWSDFKRPFFQTQADHWLILSVCHSVTPCCSLRLGWCYCSESIYYRVSEKSLQQILHPFWYFGHLLTILDTLHRFVRFWTPWPFLDAFGSLKASKKCPKCYKASKSIRTVQIVQEGPNLCNVSKIVKKCPKYQKGSKVKKVYCCFFFGT